MGPLVRLVGSGIGLASEAIAARKASKAEKQNAQASTSQRPSHAAPISRSRDPSPDPPAYSSLDPSSSHYGLVETADEEHARQLIEQGHAKPWDEPHEVEYGNVEDDDDEDEDEAYWELDERTTALEDPPAYQEGNVPGHENTDSSRPTDEEDKPDVHKLVKKFLEAHPPPSGTPPSHPLPLNVIIPQRRPHSKSRGFVRAYAPVLENAGIDQATFVAFLDTFQKASQASPVFEVIFIGGHLVGYVPSVIAMAISTSIQTLAGAAIVTQSRHRTNTFLDEINNHFFRPRGLYAMLMSYKPSRTKFSSAPTDISHSIVKSADVEGLTNKFTNNLKFSAGKSHGEVEMPESAPLIFPALDAAMSDQNPEAAAKKQNAFKKSGKFIAEYMDRRAQAEYNAENPDSTLTVPQERHFASRYSDPNHPANSGHLLSLVTGGKFDPRAQMGQRRAKMPIGRVRKATGTDKPLRKILRANVLYLMVVNMPSGEEMEAARAEIEREKREKKEKKARGEHVEEDED